MKTTLFTTTSKNEAVTMLLAARAAGQSAVLATISGAYTQPGKGMVAVLKYEVRAR